MTPMPTAFEAGVGPATRLGPRRVTPVCGLERITPAIEPLGFVLDPTTIKSNSFLSHPHAVEFKDTSPTKYLRLAVAAVLMFNPTTKVLVVWIQAPVTSSLMLCSPKTRTRYLGVPFWTDTYAIAAPDHVFGTIPMTSEDVNPAT